MANTSEPQGVGKVVAVTLSGILGIPGEAA
ncbi:hypothetical protein EES42_36800 [Streptomyces sp. ADI95-17]|nr:hypothetical protein EES42_36800 [Streptomyces sp. ADI95-17]